MTTLREHLDNIQAIHLGVYTPPVCQRCGAMHPCETFSEAEAAIAILSAAHDTSDGFLLIRDEMRNEPVA